MFKSIITNNQLVSETANDYFKNIYGDSYRSDISFISTLRALAAPRMNDGDSLSVVFNSSRYSESDIKSVSSTSAVKAICSGFDERSGGRIFIHNFCNSTQENNHACLELIKKQFCSVYKGWHRLEKVTEFYHKQFLVMCFINPEHKSVAIFIDNMDVRKMHYLQCSIFAFLPWYFDPKEGVSELEMELINSLRDKTSTRYEDTIKKIAAQYDFRAAKIRKLLSKFETKFEERECETLRDIIEEANEKISSLNRQIGEQLRNKNEFEIKLLGLEKKIADASEDSEIMEYFLCNDKLVLINVRNNKLVFGVKTNLEYFDEDMADAAIRNKHSYLYYPNGYDGSGYIPAESIEKLMNAIFIDQILKIKICAAYEFDLNGAVFGMQHYPFDSEFNDYMPNPHIDGYRCLGNYQITINELLQERDYITAIEQCIASAKSLNFGDSTVMSLFSKTIYQISEYNNRCIELPDGRIVNPKEAISWLEEQEGKDE